MGKGGGISLIGQGISACSSFSVGDRHCSARGKHRGSQGTSQEQGVSPDQKSSFRRRSSQTPMKQAVQRLGAGKAARGWPVKGKVRRDPLCQRCVSHLGHRSSTKENSFPTLPLLDSGLKPWYGGNITSAYPQLWPSSPLLGGLHISSLPHPKPSSTCLPR